jgi:hypothetical protein
MYIPSTTWPTALAELRDFQKSLEGDVDFVDVKFFGGSRTDATDDEIAQDALILLKGGTGAVDVTDEIL